MAIVKISDLPLVDQPVEGTDLFVVVQDNVTKKAYASDIQTYVGFEEFQIATAGQTVFNLTTMTYAAGANNLQVFVDGVNQYVGSSYLETDNNTVTFTQGLHEGALVKFSTVQTLSTVDTSAANILFTQGGTGAVTRSVQSKERDIISAKDFGAVGDGVADDTAALQAFLNACQNNRGYIPAGIYKTTAALNLYPQYSYNIEGTVFRNTANSGTVIYNTGTGHCISLDNEPYTPPNFDSQIRLSNMTLRGNSNSLDGINVQHAMIYLENVWITDHGGNGLSLERAYATTCKQVICASNNKWGALISIAGNLMHFDHCVFNGNSKLDNYGGVRLTASPDPLAENFALVFTSCDFTANGNHSGVTTAIGALIQKGIGVSLIGCYWEENKTYNLYADSSSKNLTVSGCYFQDGSNEITSVEGLIYENNFHLYVDAPTPSVTTISAGMPSARLPARIFGNTYSGGASSSMVNGASENIQLWYSSPPSGGTWKRGDIVWNSNFQNGGGNHGWVCIVAGTPGTWIALGQVPYVYANWGDANATLTPFASFPTNIWRAPLSADRTVTLSTTNAVSGVKFRITRSSSATGAFNLNVGSGPLKALAAGQWCDVEWDGADYQLTAFGSL